MSAKTEEKKGMIGTAAAVAIAAIPLALLFLPMLIAKKVTFPSNAWFEPQKVKFLADQLTQGSEDEFILSAWDLVGRGLVYEAFGSDIDIDQGIITCDKCFTTDQILNRGGSNCVGKSAMLASLLLNRLPANRVYMAIGHFAGDGVGGHAWCLVDRGGTDYLLEATSPPPAQPWTPASLVSRIYIPYAVFSPESFECLDHQFCLQVGNCNCGERIKEVIGGLR